MAWLTRWTAGLSDGPPLLLWLGMPLLLAMAASFSEAQPPRWRWLGRAVVWNLLLVLGLRLGRYALHWPAPGWVWAVAVIVLPWRLSHNASPRFLLLVWLFSLCAALAALLQWAAPALPRTANDLLMACGLAGWAVCALAHWVWPRHREPPAAPTPPTPEAATPPPPALDEATLRQHLDSPAAQEGADKYTRE